MIVQKEKTAAYSNASGRAVSRRTWRIRLILLCLLSALLLAGCAGGGSGSDSASSGDTSLMEIPEADENGRIPVGSSVLAPAQFENFEIGEYNAALTASGFYYATWVTGSPTDYTNSDGDEAKLYDAQVYMVVYEGTDPDDAASKAAGWLEAARQSYRISETSTQTLGDGITPDDAECTVLAYTNEEASNPFAAGASAFFSSGKTAVCVEAVHTSGWNGDPGAVLDKFLKQMTVSQ